MVCEKCGNKLNEGDKICANCQNKIEELNENKNITTDTKAVWSLVLGILSFSGLPILSIPGLILGKNSTTKNGVRTAGIILNLIAVIILIGIVMIIGFFWIMWPSINSQL